MPAANGQAGEDDPRQRDYAIIVGIKRYPRLTRWQGKPADLEGPENDAQAVYDWIVSPEGGGVPRCHVKYVIRNGETRDGMADPTRDTVVEAFTDTYGLCVPHNRPPKIPMGRRLYVYVSGHGMAADLDHGALLCSNSTESNLATVAPYAAIGAFRMMSSFEEFVVWFDGCMDWEGREPEAILYSPAPKNMRRPAAPMFVAYAAHPPRKTMESRDDKGIMRGVFTRALLAGLNGEAVNKDTGLVDGPHLKAHLYNKMSSYFPPSANADPTIDTQASVEKCDERIIFGIKKKVPVWPVVLHFGPGRDGAEAQVWGRKDGQSLSVLASLPIQAGEVKLELPNGIYAVDVPRFGLRAGFQVTGETVTKLLAQ